MALSIFGGDRAVRHVALGVLRFDFGTSLWTGRPVIEELLVVSVRPGV